MPDDSKKNSIQTNYSLIERVRDPHDKKSWQEFVRHYEQYIYNVLRHIGLSETDAEEICQNIIIKLWKKLPDFQFDKNRGKFRAWLRTIIYRDAYSHFSKNKTQRKYIEFASPEDLLNLKSEHEFSNLDKAIIEEWDIYTTNLAWSLVKERFKGNMQQIFLLYMDGKSVKEISEEMGIKDDNIYVYIQRIKKHLKEARSVIEEELR